MRDSGAGGATVRARPAAVCRPKEEARDRKIMILLLRIKNGNPLQRKGALRQITESAVSFGAGPLFNR